MKRTGSPPRLPALLALCAWLAGGQVTLPAADCNRNGVEDDLDVAAGASLDCNGNLNPDECDIAEVNFGFAPVDAQQVGSTSAAAAADLDGDGRIDLVAALDLAGQLAVLLNAGSWSFPETVYFSIAVTPSFVLARDLDADGAADVAIAGAEGISVAWGDGRGAFDAETVVPTGNQENHIDAGDVDADGDLDLAIANDDRELAVSIIAAQGRTLSPPRDLVAGESASAVALEDLDLDGDLDLAVATQWSNRLFVLRNDGSGDFVSHLELDLLMVLKGMAAADLDGDARVDLSVVSGLGTVIPFHNRGDAQLTRGTPVATDASYGDVVYPAAADLDGDRDVDLVLGLNVLLNGGEGSLVLTERNAGSYLARPTALADLDGDLDPDVAAPADSLLRLLANRPVAWRPDCNLNRVPDDCEADCNCNRVPDDCDLAGPGARDCNANRLPDDCERDCNRNRVPDDCELAAGDATDCDGDGTPDECQLVGRDCNANGILDDCDLRAGARDCNGNGIPDLCDVAPSFGLAGQERLALTGESLAVLDLDADGALDIAAGGPGGIRAVLGDGLWRPWRLVDIAPTGGPFAAADLDLDGDLDVCIAAGRGDCAAAGADVRVLLGSGDASFVAAGVHALATRIQSLAPGDFDRDGRSDFAAGGPGATWLYRAVGSGALEAPVLVADTGGALAAADFDADGDLDLAAADTDIDVGSLLVSTGPGAFVRAETTFVTDGGELLATDLDADLDVDLVTGGGWVLRNGGRGSFGELFPRQARSHEGRADTVAAGEWDGDGLLDLAWLEGGLLTTYFQDGAGRYLLAARLNPPSAPGLASGDLDADGLDDLVLGGAAHILFNLGDASSFGRRAYFLGGASSVVHGAAAGDLDGDGDADLAMADGAQLRLLVNAGAGRHEPGPNADLAGGPIVLLDLDGDGDLDVAAGAREAPAVLTLRNDGGLVLTRRESFLAGGRPVHLAAADWDDDGKADVAAAHGTGAAASLLLGGPRGALATPLLLELGGPQTFVAAWDHDGDGDLDLACGLPGAERVSALTQDESGRFAPGPVIEPGGEAGAGQAGDFDGDGRDDLALALAVHEDCAGFGCRVVGKVVAFLQQVDGPFLRSVPSAGRGISRSLAAADLDGDGDLDLAFPLGEWLEFDYFVSQDAVAMSRNHGAGLFASPDVRTVGSGPHTVVAADLDGSGGADLAVVSTQSLTVLLTRLDSTSSDVFVDGTPDECWGRPFRRGDANGDATVDIADMLQVLLHLFAGRAAPPCSDAGDLDDDGFLSLTDAVFGLTFLFLGGPPPAPPHFRCGVDFTPDPLDCAESPPCP